MEIWFQKAKKILEESTGVVWKVYDEDTPRERLSALGQNWEVTLETDSDGKWWATVYAFREGGSILGSHRDWGLDEAVGGAVFKAKCVLAHNLSSLNQIFNTDDNPKALHTLIR